MDMQVFLWALAGGMIVAVLGGMTAFFKKESPTTKQLGRDFILGAAFTGFLYPMIPETFDEMKEVVSSKTGDIVATVASTAGSVASGDPGIQIGPPNF